MNFENGWYDLDMEITYLGHSCFKLKNKGGITLLIDPFDKDFVGLPLAKEMVDIAISTHDHNDHNALSMVEGPVNRAETFMITKEGDYEIGGVEVGMMRSFHDSKEGAESGKNLMALIRMDGLTVLQTGDLGHKLTESQIEKMGDIDVLCVPVGGTYTLSVEDVVSLVKDISPSYVIPMHYKVPGINESMSALLPVENFVEKMKLPLVGEPVHKYKVDTGSLPDDTQVLVMNA